MFYSPVVQTVPVVPQIVLVSPPPPPQQQLTVQYVQQTDFSSDLYHPPNLSASELKEQVLSIPAEQKRLFEALNNSEDDIDNILQESRLCGTPVGLQNGLILSMAARGVKRHLSEPARQRNNPSYNDSSSEGKRYRPNPKSGVSFISHSKRIDNQKINSFLIEHYNKMQQPPEMYSGKMQLREALNAVLKAVFPYAGLYVVGSSMNGFGTNKSDMDLCLMLTHLPIDQRQEAFDILRIVQRSLRKLDFISNILLIPAKVPILKFTDNLKHIECDLNINNHVGIRNTHLLNAYSKIDWRIKPLVIFVKSWAKFQNINDASQGTISSYSIVLMVLHYLQCGCNPPVIPNLQRLYPNKFSNQTDIRSLTLNERMDYPPSNNSQSVGKIFIGFLKYFSEEFDFDKYVISIRTGTKLLKSTVIRENPENHSQWKCLCIEEPFDRTNTARSCFDTQVFQRVHTVFKKSYQKVLSTASVSHLLSQSVHE